VLDLNGLTGLTPGRRMGSGPLEGEEEREERDGFAVANGTPPPPARSRTEDEGDEADPMLSFLSLDMAKPEGEEATPANSPEASCLGGCGMFRTGMGDAALGVLLAVREGRMKRSAIVALSSSRLGGDRDVVERMPPLLLLMDESRWLFLINVGTKPSLPPRSCEMKRDDSTDSSSSS
jgi:hypothetical protein